jgi:hypothetical protein
MLKIKAEGMGLGTRLKDIATVYTTIYAEKISFLTIFPVQTTPVR